MDLQEEEDADSSVTINKDRIVEKNVFNKFKVLNTIDFLTRIDA